MMPASFDVTRVIRTVDLTPGANLGYVYEVQFTTKPHGAQGFVTVPEKDYSAETALEVAGAKADELERTFAP